VNALSSTTLLRQLDLSFARRGPRTVFDRRIFSWPFVLTRTFSLDAAQPEVLTLIVQSSGGPIHGADDLRQRIVVGEHAAVDFQTQGAAAVHRALPGQGTHERVELSLAAGARLDYLPQPRILFPDAALTQSIDVDLAFGATLLLADAFTIHDPRQSGRLFLHYDATLTVRRDGDPLLIDRFVVAGEAKLFTRHAAFGTLICVVGQSGEGLQRWSGELNSTLEQVPGLYAAASVLPSGIGLGLRFAAAELRELRLGFEIAVDFLRSRLKHRSSTD